VSDEEAGLVLLLELPVDQALVVSDLLLKEYIKFLQVGEGGLPIPAELVRLLEPARAKIRAVIRPKSGCRVELRDDEMVALGFALLAYLIHAKRDEAGRECVPLGGLKAFQLEALHVLAKIIEAMGAAGMPTAARIYQIGCLEGFFSDDDGPGTDVAAEQ
jgi:hypothetical protein